MATQQDYWNQYWQSQGGFPGQQLPAPPGPGVQLPAPPPVVTPQVLAAGASPLLVPQFAQKSTHLYDPLVSGGPGYVKGVVLLAYRFEVDAGNGLFTSSAPGAQILFPANSILWKVVTSVTTAFNGTTPALNLGTVANGVQVGTIALGTAGSTEAPTSPAIIGVLSMTAAATVYLSLTGTGTTTGHADVAILYLGSPALPWG
jgi:hypothetical protein